MKKPTRLLLAVGLIAGLGAASAAPAPAVAEPSNDAPPQACYEQVTERRYERTTETIEYRWDIERRSPIIQEKIEKEVRKITSVDPIVWSEWADWSAPALWDDGRNRGPASHGSGNGNPGTEGYAEFRYIVVDTRPNGFTAWSGDGSTEWGPSDLAPLDGETVRYVNPQSRAASSIETTDWLTEAPAGDGWTQIEERQVQGERIPCPVEKLRLTFIQECGVWNGEGFDPPAEVQWRLRNGNDGPTAYKLRQAGGGTIQEGTLPPGDTFVTLPFGARTLILETLNDLGGKAHQDTKAGGDTFLTDADDAEKCAPPPPPPPPSRLGLTFNQDCLPDDANTWRIRPVDVNGPVKWELENVGGSTIASGTMNPGDGEVRIEDAPLRSETARLRYDSDQNGTLDKQTVKAGGSALTPESNPELYEPGAKCGPPETTVPPTTEPEPTVPEPTVPEPTVPETTEPEPTVPETTQPAPNPTQPTPRGTLPQTGGGDASSGIALAALVSLLGGLGLLGATRLARRG